MSQSLPEVAEATATVRIKLIPVLDASALHELADRLEALQPSDFFSSPSEFSEVCDE